ncbi:NADH-ubiquinone oxidoreductase ASHI subunit [Aphelenchoides besseyi]|nr:NADH-ubiquinone oxidoreductase ASHI subunit [Aphelenchoides besseyi]KAI6194051.1 NADH-ubiquinone oxidoreductase ASHI subunit [Aphelenchoides besseyi]
MSSRLVGRVVTIRSLHKSVKNEARGPLTHPGWFLRDHQPNEYPKNEEERRASAVRYGLRPEDYHNKDPYEAYTDSWNRRNWGEQVIKDFMKHQGDRNSFTGLDIDDFTVSKRNSTDFPGKSIRNPANSKASGGCFGKCFVEEDDRNTFNFRRGRPNNRRGSSVHGIYSRLDGNRPSTSRASATQNVEKNRSVGRPSTKSLKKLAVNTGPRNWLSVNSQNEHFQFETPSASSSFRASPVSNDHSPTPSTSRLSTPAYTPGPVSPAIRQSFSSGYNQPSTSNFSRYQQGYSSVGQTNGNGPLNAVAMTAQSFSSFQINSPMSGSISPQPIDFDPVSTAMPSFAGVNESRHGRPRKLTTRVKQMLNAQRTHRPGIPTSFGNAGQYMSPLSTQSYSASNSSANKAKPRPGVRPRGRPKSRPVVVDEEPVDAFADDDFGEEVEVEDDRDTDYTEAEEENGDDNRPWCFCKTKSYGEMVACESGRCPIEWFHFQCVNLTEPPKGVWICPVCRAREQNRAA